MKTTRLSLVSACLFFCIHAFSQQAIYDVIPGNGNGIRFWQADNWKIHMGNTAEYIYGTVTDYSIKMNMDNNTSRGWTWGVSGVAPVASLNTQGHMQIAGNFVAVGNVGIGKTNPAHKLDVNGVINAAGILINGAPFAGGGSQWATSGSNIAFTAGNIGIGVASPQTRLTLRANTSSQGLVITNCDVTGGQSHLAFTTADQPRLGIGPESYLNIYNDGKWNINSAQTNGTIMPISLNTNNISRIYIKADGTVGIGTTDPKGYRLAIAGKAVAEEIVVKLQSAWPDYAFEDTYKPMDLLELEQYIKANRHLPEVPTAEEVNQNGLSVGEMNALLLKKVEELTLYLIEANKTLQKQQDINARQEKDIESLKRQLVNK